MEKVQIIKQGITRSVFPKDAAKWLKRGYTQVEVKREPIKAKASKAE